MTEERAALVTKPYALQRGSLPDRLQAAIRAAEEAQQPAPARDAYRGAAVELPSWQTTADGIRFMDLREGVRFVPDETQARAGGMSMLFGALAAFVGVIFAFDQSEAWMPVGAAAMIAGGGFAVTSGWRAQRAGKTAPRTTGVYLFDDLLLHVQTVGCTVVPRDRIRAVEYGYFRNRHTLRLSYVDPDDALEQMSLMDRDASQPIRSWMDQPVAS